LVDEQSYIDANGYFQVVELIHVKSRRERRRRGRVQRSQGYVEDEWQGESDSLFPNQKEYVEFVTRSQGVKYERQRDLLQTETQFRLYSEKMVMP
jgi:hypothetical protein